MWRAFGLQPFDRSLPLLLLVAAVAGTATWLLPALPSPFGTLLLRGGTLTLLYGAGLLLTRTAPELLALATGLWHKVIK